MDDMDLGSASGSDNQDVSDDDEQVMSPIVSSERVKTRFYTAFAFHELYFCNKLP
jgi:hypothetical protein